VDYENPWIFEGKPFTDDSVGDLFGFVYVITNKTAGKKYIGKKLFTVAGYKTIKGKRKKIRKPSDWKEYWSSSNKLKEDVATLGKQHFTREIVRLCPNRSSASYYEAKMIFETDAILSDSYYNDWVTVRISSVHVKAIYK
jgi:hypothetical protein